MDTPADKSTNLRHSKSLSFFSSCLFLAIAALLFYHEIELRPPHNDESVNFLLMETIAEDGYYKYSHENYHGPLFFYLLRLAVNYLGDSLAAIRTPGILSGLLCLLSLQLLSPIYPRLRLIAGLLLLSSPSFCFFSRYAIHETLFLLFSLLTGLSVFRFFESYKTRWIYLSGTALALAVATKETSIILLSSLALCVLSISKAADYRELWRKKYHLLASTALSLSLIAAIFSAFFTKLEGINELLLSIPQWFNRGIGDRGHFKHLFYYITDIILLTEPQLLIAVVLGPFAIYSSERNSLRRFLIYSWTWATSCLLCYSLIPYKTPWLVININLPLILLLSTCLLSFFSKGKYSKLISASLLLISLSHNTIKLAQFNYLHWPLPSRPPVSAALPYGPGNPFSYVHTAAGTLSLLMEMEKYWEAKPEAKVLIGVKGYFPLPYYFRKKSDFCSYELISDIDRKAQWYDVMILEYPEQFWQSPDWERRYYRLSDYQEAYVYFKR